MTPGVFPYRILYQREKGKMGVGLRWALESADGVMSAFTDMPGSRLYTDAYMHDSDSEALTGSIAGKLSALLYDDQACIFGMCMLTPNTM